MCSKEGSVVPRVPLPQQYFKGMEHMWCNGIYTGRKPHVLQGRFRYATCALTPTVLQGYGARVV